MEKWLSRIGVLLVALFSGALHAAVGSCPVNFADGIQSHYSGSDGNRGVINFEWNAQLLNSPDNVLQARRVTRNSGSSVGTCGGRWVIWWPPYQAIECQADPSSAAPVQAAGAFPNTAANTLDRTYNSGSSVLAASGSNQYDNVTVGSSAQLTIQSNGQPFYIDNLTLRSSSRLILAPGDYWIGSLTTNNAARIQVSGSSGQVRLFIRDSLSVGSDVLLNSPSIDGQGDPQRLFLYAYDSVSFNNGTTMSGYLYSAASQSSGSGVNLGSASYVYGAITAQNVTMGTNSRVYYIAPSEKCVAEPPAELVLSWSMDENLWSGATGEVRDDSGNGLHGRAIAGAVTNGQSPALPEQNGEGTCRYGRFARAASQYLQSPHNDLLTQQGDFTVGLWVRPRSYPSSGTLMSILSKDNNYEFHLNSNGTINWWWQTTGGATNQFNSTTAIPLNAWSHVLIRYTAGAQRIYINGNLAGSATLSGTPIANADSLQVGWDKIAGRHFNGDLDEVRIYKGALSQAEIEALVLERHPCATNLQCFSNFLDPATFGANWAVSSRGLTNFVPQLVNGRLRLTSNAGNVATAAALQRLFPAEGQFIQVSFKHYAYNGNGADGIAMILSDAEVTPQPGGYGGSLGYAQLNGQSGFAGGWLGVAIDEYGNFSNPTEDRNGGPGLRPDTVSVRGSGSGTSGYRYIAGTGTALDPGIDSPGSSSPAPGHVYRITVDGRTSGQARLTVERNAGSGFEVLPNLDGLNVLSATGQIGQPEAFYLSFTGSTGGQNNVHEIEALEVCATDIRPLTERIHHFRFNYVPEALTCNPHEVTITACMNADCSEKYLGQVTATLSPGSGWSAGNPVTFSGGSTTVRLRSSTPGTVQLGVTATSPQAQSFSQTICSTPNCQLAFADSGFLFDVPNLIAARPETGIVLQAVKKDAATQACVPGFAGGTRTLQFSSTYVDPGTGTRQVQVNDTAVTGSPTNVSLTFDNQARAQLQVRYDDAGLMNLLARYAPTSGAEAGLVMTGSDQFSSRPYGLCVMTDVDAPAGTAACTTNDINCPVFAPGNTPVRAGDSFRLLVRPVGWQANGEALTAAQLCSGNIDTPNFAMNGISLAPQRLAPTPGVDGTLAVTTYNHLRGGQATVESQAYSEVGIIQVTATPQGTYFGETVSGGTSNRIGRFTPAYLGAAGSASLTPSCGAFSYQGQPIGFASTGLPTLTVTGYNRAGNPTLNYDRGAFWRLTPPAAPSYVSQTGLASVDPRMGVEGTATIATEGANDGNGSRTYRWSGQRLFYDAAATASDEDLPFQAELDLRFNAAALTDADGVCHGNTGSCQGYEDDFDQAPGSEVRLGRLRIDNAHGSERQALELPLIIETWRDLGGARFALEQADTCTVPGNLGAVAFTAFTGELNDGETTPSVGPFTGGKGALTLSAPGEGNHGSARLHFPALVDWLRYGWDGAGRRSATGTATFGVYQGATPLIFRREIYRSM